MSANVKIEWILLSVIDNTTVAQNLGSSQYISCNTTVQANSAAAANVSLSANQAYASRVVSVDNAIYAGVGNSSFTLSTSGNNGYIIEPGKPAQFLVANGQFVYTIQVPTNIADQVTAPKAEATGYSNTIAIGGTAQDLFAAAAVNGWEFQNQSDATLYIRSKGSAGNTVATQDNNSLVIKPWTYFTPSHVSAYGYSIVGPETGQAFYCRTY